MSESFIQLNAKKDPLAEQNSNVAKVLPMSKLPMPGSSKLPIPGSSKLPLPGASSSIKQTSTITKPVKRKSNHNEHASKRAKFECDSANMSVLAAAPNFELPPVAKPVARSTTTRAGAGVARKPPSKAAPLKSVGSNLNVTKLPNATAALGANGNGTKPQNKPGETKSFTFKAPQAVPSTSQAFSKPAAAAPPAGVGKGKRPAWDTKGRLQDMEETMSRHLENNSSLQQQILLSNERIALLESMNQQLSGTVQQKEQQTTVATTEICSLQRRLKEAEEELDIERTKFRRQLDDLEFSRSTLARQKATLESELTASREEVAGLKTTVATMSASQAGIESELSSTKIRLASAESLCRDRATEIVSLKQTIVEHLNTIDEANTKLRAEEGIRRKLHNTILELKGNIRVFSRIRPLLGDELLGSNGEIAHMHFPDNDHKILELERLGDVNPNESVAAFRKGTSNKYEFSFDRVFDPSSSQDEVFEEISQLVQSALDGYNVCIFAYGQTGSGKTYTMEGVRGMSGDQRGIIPRSVEQVFKTSRDLLEKGWAYTFEVSFLEIYNEMIKDLIGSGDLKHEIRLVGPNSTETYVTDLTTITVTSIEQVNDLLLRASHSRSVAETKCNERSSRSHSVFRMKISGSNSLTSESCSGMLNLIDLAGSERLKESGSEGLRLKETQSINKSLANLGNVIMALANKEQHVPYRNSKLTHLLQNCLGGSSKMLMFVNVSPKEECFQETLNSLRFATKVNETNIGTAQKKVK